MRYYAQRVAEELDKYKEGALTRTTKFNLEGFVLQHYKSWLKKIAEYQNYQIKTLEGKGLAKFSGLVLEVASKRGIKLKAAKVKQLQDNARASVGYEMDYIDDASPVGEFDNVGTVSYPVRVMGSW